MSGDIIEIGNTLKLRDATDPAGKITTWFRQGLNIVDIMPASFTLDLTKEHTRFNVYNTGGESNPMTAFNNRCGAYGLDPKKKMVRLWLTGESTFQEEVSNEYQTNTIESMINGLMGSTVGAYANAFRSTTSGVGRTGFQNNMETMIKTGISSVTNTASKVIGDNAAGVIKNVADTLTTSLLNFKYLSIPKTYSGSTYNPALNFNVRLISPYGHPKAIQKFIIDPLTYIMLMAPPTTNDGVTYGSANYVSVRAYGIADIDLGIIENISIRRGGNDVAYNKYRQPMSVDVNISIKPASSGFAAAESKENPNGYKDKITNTAGIATSIAKNKASAVDNIKGNMKSSMITLGNMIESFKPMPYSGIGDPSKDPSKIQNSPPNISAIPKQGSELANTRISKSTSTGASIMHTTIV